jgi:hypothetical protein
MIYEYVYMSIHTSHTECVLLSEYLSTYTYIAVQKISELPEQEVLARGKWILKSDFGYQSSLPSLRSWQTT